MALAVSQRVCSPREETEIVNIAVDNILKWTLSTDYQTIVVALLTTVDPQSRRALIGALIPHLTQIRYVVDRITGVCLG